MNLSKISQLFAEIGLPVLTYPKFAHVKIC